MAERAAIWQESSALALALFGLSLLAWSGLPASPAALATYALADGLWREGIWHIESVRGAVDAAALIGADGRLYAPGGPALSLLLLPLIALAARLPEVGTLHGALLLAPLIHTLTGLYLYHAVRDWFPAVGRPGALATTVLWALASPALLGAGALLPEALLALSFVASLTHLRRGGRGWRGPLLAGLWLGLGTAALLRALLWLPLLLGLLLHNHRGEWREGGRWRWEPSPEWPVPLWAWMLSREMLGRLGLLLLPVLGGAELHLWYLVVQVGRPLGVLDAAAPTDVAGGWLWLAAWLPLGLLALRHPPPGATRRSLGLVLLLVGLLAAVGWRAGASVRALLPLLPLVALAVAPLWARATLQAPLLLLGVLAAAISTGTLLAAGLPRDWADLGSAAPRLLALQLTMALLGTILAARLWRRPPGLLLLGAGTLLMTATLWWFLGDLRAFDRPALQGLLADRTLLPPDAVLWSDQPAVVPTLFNNLPRTIPLRGVPPALDWVESGRAAAAAGESARPLLLLTGPAWEPAGVEPLLARERFWSGDAVAGPWRLVRYEGGQVGPSRPAGQRWPLAAGGSVLLSESRISEGVMTGQPLVIELRVEREGAGPVPAFEGRLLDGTGRGRSQARVPPPAADGPRVTVRFALRLPALPPGRYTLEILPLGASGDAEPLRRPVTVR